MRPSHLKVGSHDQPSHTESHLLSGLNTTAGSFSLLKSIVPEDAGVVKRLRAAGAIILGMSPALLQNYYLTTTP